MRFGLTLILAVNNLDADHILTIRRSGVYICENQKQLPPDICGDTQP